MNGTINGSAISHTARTSQITLNSPGTYVLSYTGTATAQANSGYPVTNLVQFAVNGTALSSPAVTSIFSENGESSSQSMTAIVTVASAPATVTVVPGTGNFTYSNYSVSAFKLA